MKSTEHIIYSNSAAKLFNEAYPIGNGKLGGMVYGEPKHMRLGLNHDELWAGCSHDNAKTLDKNDYSEAKRLALIGEYAAAEEILCNKVAIYNAGAYLTLGDLFVDFRDEEVTDYRRELDLRNSVSTVSFKLSGSAVTVKYIASNPDNVLCVRIDTEKEESYVLSPEFSMSSAKIISGNRIISYGECAPLSERQLRKGAIDVEGRTGIRFVAGFDCKTDGNSRLEGGKLFVENAKSTVAYVSAETSFLDGNEHKKENYKELLVSYLDGAVSKSFDELFEAHVSDVRALYDRVDVSFESENEQYEELPTGERIKNFAEGKQDNALVGLAFNMGRYLLISASRPGSRATTLQGIWNDSMDPPWSSNYTVNINTEMNYWPALACSLPELIDPLEELIRTVYLKTGRDVAKYMFGAEGFAANHNMDVFGYATPAFGWPGWSYFPVSVAWLLRELYNKYEYTLDKDYLERIWRYFEESSRFFLDVLVDDGDYLIMCPGASAENCYLLENGSKCSIARSSTVFGSIIRENLEYTVKIAEILGKDSEVARRASEALPRLLPLRITEDGRIEEWYFGGKSVSPVEPEPTHRHLSHLYDLYPGNKITPDTPELFCAAKESLRVRGDEATGWSLGWKMNCYARLRDGEGVMRLLRMFLRPIEPDNLKNLYGGGVYPNLFCAHPPFQIDGNFGYTAGIAEMLIGYRDGEPVALPAIPKELSSGHAYGIAIKGNKHANLEWKNGKVTKFEII